MGSLKTQIIAAVALIVGVVLIGVMCIAYFNVSNLVQNNLEEKFQIQAKELANEFDIHVQQEKMVVTSFGKQATNQYFQLAGDVERQFEITKRIQKDFPQWTVFCFSPDVVGKTVATSLGSTIDGSKWGYATRLVAGKVFFDEPKISIATGQRTITGIAPIAINGKIVGAVTGALTVEQFTKEIDETKIGQSGFCMLVSPKGLIVSYPDKQLVMENLEKLNNPAILEAMDRIRNGQSGRLITTVGGVETIVAYVPTYDGWGVFVVAPTAEQFAATVRLRWVFIGLLAGAIICTIFIANKFANQIILPLKQMVGYIEKLSEGDFTEQTLSHTDNIKYSSNNEIGQLSKAMKQMRLNLWTILQQVSMATDHVASASVTLKTGANECAQATNQVAVSVANVASGAECQAGVVNSCSEDVGRLAMGFREISDNTIEVVKSSEEAAAAAKDGRQAISNAVNQMDCIARTVTNSAEIITKLGARSKEIGEIVNTISGIAGQTNLLALNAAIEAARAGGQGRGFAVVADEVRKLAEQSHEAAKRIAALIGEIQNETYRAVESMNVGTKEVELGIGTIDSAGKMFNQIVCLIDQVSNQIREISTSTQELADGGKRVAKSMQDIIEINNKTVDETETVSAATQEQSATMEEIAASSNDLSRLANELRNNLRKFQI